MSRLEETVSISELFERMRREDLVIVPRGFVKQEQLKEKILRKKWITYKEIADSQIWNAKSKSGVERIVKEDVDKDCLDTSKQPFKIHRSEVERIAKNRGTI